MSAVAGERIPGSFFADVVLPGCVWLLGDNRRNSTDSLARADDVKDGWSCGSGRWTRRAFLFRVLTLFVVLQPDHHQSSMPRLAATCVIIIK